MGYINNTPVFDIFSQAELGKEATSKTKYNNFAEANAIIGRKVLSRYTGDQWGRGLGHEWPERPKVEGRP